jgi:hypothetical protein
MFKEVRVVLLVLAEEKLNSPSPVWLVEPFTDTVFPLESVITRVSLQILNELKEETAA